MIRINSDRTADLLTLLAGSQRREEIALQQLSTGRRVNSPSDDPSAAAAMVENYARSSADDQFKTNIESVREMLSAADSSLSSVVNSLTRAISLATEGTTGTQSASNRQSIANEIRGIKEQVLSIANLSFRGRYVFAGSATDLPPYAADSIDPSVIAYNGNAAVNSVPVGERQTIEVNRPGTAIFGPEGNDVFSALEETAKALESGDPATMASSGTYLRSSFDHIVAARVFYGNTLNQLEAQESFLDQEVLQLKTQENQLVGVDPAKAISDVQQAQFARQATLAAAARSSNMSLLDFLK